MTDDKRKNPKDDILTRVLWLHKFIEKSGREKTISEHSDRVLAQNFEAVLAVIAILAKDLIFAKFCQEVYKHILRHP